MKIRILLIIGLVGMLALSASAEGVGRTLKVKGKINHPQIKTVKINDSAVAYNRESGEFETTLALEKAGKNTLLVTGLNREGKVVSSKRVRLLNLARFKDVKNDHWAAKQISYLSTLSIVNGYPDATFKPDHSITRAEMAAILMRAREEAVPQPKAVLFKDLPLAHWANKYVDAAARAGIIKGYPDKTFKPNQNISRAEGLTMIARFAGLEPESYSHEFADVTSAHWAARILAAASKAGLTEYLKGEFFSPNRKLSRAEAVEMLSRTSFAKTKIADLLSFEIGYEEVKEAQVAQNSK